MERIKAPESQLASWKLYSIWAPVLIFFIAWGAGWIFDIPDSFIATFGTGDLLPLAAIILLGVSADVEHEAVFMEAPSKSMVRLKDCGTFFAIFCLASFGLVKGKALTLLVKQPLPSVATLNLTAFSVFSLIALISAVSLGLYTKTRLTQEQTDRILATSSDS